MMKSALIALATLSITSGAVLAAPGGYGHRGHDGSRVTMSERAVIARSAFQVARLKRQVWADGRVSFIERMQLRNAERRHAAIVAKARRS